METIRAWDFVSTANSCSSTGLPSNPKWIPDITPRRVPTSMMRASPPRSTLSSGLRLPASWPHCRRCIRAPRGARPHSDADAPETARTANSFELAPVINTCDQFLMSTVSYAYYDGWAKYDTEFDSTCEQPLPSTPPAWSFAEGYRGLHHRRSCRQPRHCRRRRRRRRLRPIRRCHLHRRPRAPTSCSDPAALRRARNLLSCSLLNIGCADCAGCCSDEPETAVACGPNTIWSESEATCVIECDADRRLEEDHQDRRRSAFSAAGTPQ